MVGVDADDLSRAVSDLLSTSAVASMDSASEITVRLLGLERPYGFQVRISEQLGRLGAALELDTLAGRILSLMHRASELQWEQFVALALAVSNTTTSSEITANSAPIRGKPESLQTIEIRLSKRTTDGDARHDAANLAAAVFSLVLTLLPIDDDSAEVAETFEFAVEGAKSRREINHYERSRSNRAIAIAIHGTRCAACDFDFGVAYGAVGDGYIEVHHLEPVHAMGAPRVVDPANELVPLCSNCHRMAHRRIPPFTPRELTELRRQAQSSAALR